MEKPARMRIDKWLWTVRLTRTRTLAAALCEKGKVQVNGTAAKPARPVGAGDLVSLRKAAFTLEYRVLDLPARRVPAAQADACRRDVTPPETAEALAVHRMALRHYRGRGTGRPTKKERRQLDDFIDW